MSKTRAEREAAYSELRAENIALRDQIDSLNCRADAIEQKCAALKKKATDRLLEIDCFVEIAVDILLRARREDPHGF
jgi:hypothetical protein